MGLDHRTVSGGTGDGDLELARQELEFRVVGGPLSDQLGHGAWVGDLIGGGPGEMVRRHVADGVARGLDRVQLHLGQRVEHVGHVAQLGPVVLDVLTRGEVAVALVPLLGDIGELVHLRAAQRAIGDRHAQHIGVQLQVEPIHQAQRFELVLGERAVDAALDLGAELGVALGEEFIVEFGVAIHHRVSCLPWA